MRKVLVILASLAVLTSAVFAETHKIVVKGKRPEVLPAFQLKFAGEAHTNLLKVAFDGQAEYFSDIDYPTVIDFTQENQKVVFSVIVANAAVTDKVFQILFRDGVFKDVPFTDGTANDIAPAIIIDEKTATGFFTSSKSGSTVSVDFEGKAINPAVPAQALLADATFAYARHDDIKPGEYTADITVDITTT